MLLTGSIVRYSIQEVRFCVHTRNSALDRARNVDGHSSELVLSAARKLFTAKYRIVFAEQLSIAYLAADNSRKYNRPWGYVWFSARSQRQ